MNVHEQRWERKLRDFWTGVTLALGAAAALGVEALGGDGWLLVVVWVMLSGLDFRSYRRALRREAS